VAGPAGTERPDAVTAVGVAIVSWNVRELLDACLRSVRESESPGLTLRVVVVDNASGDGSAAMVRKRYPTVTVIANESNVGFTRANNQALAELGLRLGGPATEGAHSAASTISVPTAPEPTAAAPTAPEPTAAVPTAPEPPAAAPPSSTPPADTMPPEFVLLLNPDARLESGALAEMVTYLRTRPGAAAVGPQLRYPDGTIQSSRRRFPTVRTGLMESTPLAWHWPDNPEARWFHMDSVPADEAGSVDWVTGAAMLLRSSALEEIGGFDEGFFMYSEELDLCRRLRYAGYSVHYDPAAVVVHHEGGSSDQVVAARHLHFQRSRVRYFRKHHGRGAAAVVRGGVLAGFAAEIAVEGIKWLSGHKRPLRSERIRAYMAVLRDGLGWKEGER